MEVIPSLYTTPFRINRLTVNSNWFKKRMSSLLENIPVVRRGKCSVKYYNHLEEDSESFYAKMNCINFQTSYGLIVKTKNDHVVMIERRVPYCVQNFIIGNYKKNKFAGLEFTKTLKDQFEKECLPNLNKSEQSDYHRYTWGFNCEDKLDFPHGQMDIQIRKKVYANPRDRRMILFQIAYREFVEETGYRFSFNINDIYNFPLCEVQFTGLDGFQYTQYYFIVENVRNLKRISCFDCFSNFNNKRELLMERMFYKSRIIDLKTAIKQLKSQQRQRMDLKYLLLIHPEEWDKVKHERSF